MSERTLWVFVSVAVAIMVGEAYVMLHFIAKWW